MKKILLLILICTSFNIFSQIETVIESTEVEEVEVEEVVADVPFKVIKKETTTFYLITNAEKKSPSEKYPDPYLSKSGEKRAENWSKVLANVTLDAVYAKESISIKQTAQAVATGKGLGVYALEANSMNDPGFKYNTTGKNTLIVGDNASIVKFANEILGTKKYSIPEGDVYSALYIITINKNAKNSILLDVQ